MTIQIAPPKVANSDPPEIGGIFSVAYRFNALIDWIRSLSPNGATQYMTTWTDIPVGSGYTIQSGGHIRYLRVGKQVYVSIRDVTANAAGAGTMCTLPLTPTFEIPVQFGTSAAAFASHAAWMTSSGLIRAVWATGTNYRAFFAYPVS